MSPSRVRDPELASVFFMPVYLAKLFNWFWTRQHCTSADDDPLTCMKDENVRIPLSGYCVRLWA